MVKFITNHTNVGGSTEVFINLVNAFNSMGHSAVLIGPHAYPEGKCNFQLMESLEFDFEPDDHIIMHFMNVELDSRPDVKSFMFHCHEMEMFPLRKTNYFVFDKIVYVSEHQKNYHQIKHPSIVIPNPVTHIEPSKCQDKVAGVVGWIQKNKGTAKAIRNALNDGFKQVLVYGTVGHQDYWYEEVAPLIDGKVVQFLGYEENKQAIYDSISDLYIGSSSETFSLTANEAKRAGVKLHSETTVLLSDTTNEEIYKMWIKELNLD